MKASAVLRHAVQSAAAVLAFLALLAASNLASATTITPDTTADDNTVNGNCTLREAIISANTDATVDACPAGSGKDEVVLSPGTYTLTLGQLTLQSDLDILGSGRDTTTIDAAFLSRVIQVGAGIHAELSGLTLTGGHTEKSNGGGIYNAGTLTLRHSTITGNLAGAQSAGGGIYDAGTLTVISSSIRSNQSQAAGSGLHVTGTLVIVDSDVSSNTDINSGCGVGAGLYSSGTVSAVRSSFNQNGTCLGAGIYSTAGQLSLTDCSVTDNSGRDGVGISIRGGSASLTGTLISGNVATHPSQARYGGGLWMDAGSVWIQNSTISGNSAAAGGAGIYNSGGTLTIANSTFALNSGGSGTGLWTATGGTTIIANTLIKNTCREDPGTHTSSGGNLESPGNTCGFTDPTDQVNVADPMIGPLSDNTGPTWTHALLPGSPAIDAGLNANCPATDQRGVLRPFNQVCDIGAFEWGLGGTVNVNDAVTYTADPDVTLTLFTVGPPLSQVRLSNEGFGGGTWQSFNLNEPWALIPGDGPKTVYAEFRDPSNPDAIYQDSDDIVLDTSPPVIGSLNITGFDPRSIAASGTGFDLTSGIQKVEYAVGLPNRDTAITGQWVDSTPSMSVTYDLPSPFLFAPDTTYTFSLRLTNGSGLQTKATLEGSFPGLSFASQSLANGDTVGPVFSASFTIQPEQGIMEAWIEVTLDGEPIPYSYDAGTSTITFDVNGLSLGSHLLRIFALDLSGNALNKTISFLVTDPNVLVVNPSFTVVQPGEQKLFTGSGGNPGPLTWTLNCGDLGSDCGSLGVAGDGRSATLTAGQDPGTYIVTAKDSQGRADTASFAIDGSVKLSPTTISLGLGKEQVFTATGGRAPYSWTSSGGSGTPSGTQNEIYSYTAGQQVGSFAVRVQDADAKSATATVTVLLDHGRAIIVGGGGSASSNPILRETEFLTRFAYKAMNVKGFSRDDIYYLTPYGTDSTCGGPGPKYRPPWDGDGDGNRCNDVDSEATKANVQNAITEWAKTTAGVGPNVPLWIYLMDHGMPNQFLVNQTCTTIGCDNGPENTITATELDSWLDALEAAAPGTPIYLVYDACYSGSFIEELSAPNRVLLLSTRPDQLSYYSPNGSASFSSYLFTNLIAGLSALDSFVSTRLGLPSSWHQTPGLDDNGNGAVNDQTDGNVARDVYLGAKAGGSALPVVVGGTASQTIEGDWPITLEASVLSDVQPDRVWVAIASPTDPMNVTEVDLAFADDPGTPEWEYSIDYPSGFPETGNWQLLFSAQVEGVASAPREITLTVTPSRKCGRVGEGPIGAGVWLALVLLPAGVLVSKSRLSASRGAP